MPLVFHIWGITKVGSELPHSQFSALKRVGHRSFAVFSIFPKFADS